MVAGIISQAIALTSSDFDTARSMTSRPTGDIIAPPTPCSMRAATRNAECRRLRAGDRAEGEQRDRGAEYRPRAEAIRQPSAGRNEHRKRQQIGGQRDVHVQRIGVEALRHRRQGGGEHRAVELLHEHGAGDDERNGACAGSARRWFGPWRHAVNCAVTITVSPCGREARAVRRAAAARCRRVRRLHRPGGRAPSRCGRCGARTGSRCR